MKNIRDKIRFGVGMILLVLAFPIVCWVAFCRGWRRSLNNARHLSAYEAATRPIHGRR